MSKKKPLKPLPKKANTTQPKVAGKPKRDYTLIFLWVIIGIVSIIRYRLIAVPFERDEGEYGYIGNLFLHGVAPFKDAYSMKLPGTSFMYAIFMLIFGHTNSGVHLGLLFMNAATMYFLYTAFKKIFNPFVALVTSTIYGFMAIGLVFDAFAAHATHFICFYSSIGFLFLAQFMKSGKPLKVFLFGLMIGMAFIMKQQAIFLIVFGAVFLFIYLKTEKKESLMEIIKKLALFSAGVFAPYLLVVLIILMSGRFSIFWLWTVQYASKYESVKNMDLIIAMFNISFQPAWDSYKYLWLLSLGGLIALYWSPFNRIQKLFAILYFVATACILSAGFYFRQHYFIALLPALGLMCGIFHDFIVAFTQKIDAYMRKLGLTIFTSIFKPQFLRFPFLSLVVIGTIKYNYDYFFNGKIYTPQVVCETAYRGNPFNQAQEVAKFIKDNTKDTDKIAVLGSEPEIYFYADRRAATGYLYTYPLVENQPYNQSMQDEMIREIDKNKPAFIVFCKIQYSWLPQPGAPKTIFDWSGNYINDHYTPVGFADFYNDKGWFVYWYDEMVKHSADVPNSRMAVLRRNPDKKI